MVRYSCLLRAQNVINNFDLQSSYCLVWAADWFSPRFWHGHDIWWLVDVQQGEK